VENDNDRKILCSIFHSKGLLCEENIPTLLKGSSLTKEDIEGVITSSQSSLDVIHSERLVHPRQLATALPYSKYGGKMFSELDRDDEGTILKHIEKNITALNLFFPAKD
jgi:hypothetical protein